MIAEDRRAVLERCRDLLAHEEYRCPCGEVYAVWGRSDRRYFRAPGQEQVLLCDCGEPLPCPC